jgi:predicted O-methyltransferase YrrM
MTTPSDLTSETLAGLLASRDTFPSTERALPDEANVWAIERVLGRFLARLVVETRPASVLEFGAGQSSVLLAESLALIGGGRLTSIDHQAAYCTDAWRQVAARPTVDAELVVAPLRRRAGVAGLYYRYDGAAAAIRRRGPYDLVFIDGPPQIFGRDAALHDAGNLLRPGALIVLDDAARPGERTAVRRWLRAYPGLELLLFDPDFARGIAILRSDGRTRARLSPRNVAGSVHDEMLWGARRREALQG